MNWSPADIFFWSFVMGFNIAFLGMMLKDFIQDKSYYNMIRSIIVFNIPSMIGAVGWYLDRMVFGPMFVIMMILHISTVVIIWIPILMMLSEREQPYRV